MEMLTEKPFNNKSLSFPISQLSAVFEMQPHDSDKGSMLNCQDGKWCTCYKYINYHFTKRFKDFK